MGITNEDYKIRINHFNLIEEIIQDYKWNVGETINLTTQLVVVRTKFLRKEINNLK